jgi:1-acyl-sn-glycerol-3-phosphate acyltransferase
MLYIRSLLFSMGMLGATLVFSLLALLLAPLPFLWRYRIIMQWNTFNLWWLKLTCGIDYVLEGSENVPQEPAIVFSKHQSTWETMALTRIFPPQVWVLKRELLWVPFFGWGLALLQPIAINRGAGRKAVQQIIHTGCQRLATGRWVIVFPEGTRIPPGKKGRYGIGGAVLAEASGAPVVPVAHNAGEYWPRRSFIKRPGTIHMVIGPVIRSEGKSAQQIRQCAEQWIEQTMQRITNKKYLDQ